MTQPGRWADAALAAVLFAADPVGLGGVRLRAGAGPAREAWLALLRDRLPPTRPPRRVPPHVTAERLAGGIDLNATIEAGRPVRARGLLDEAAGGVLLLPMAERTPPALAAIVAAGLDGDGGFGVVLLDEARAEDDERAPGALCDRLAFDVTLDGVAMADCAVAAPASAGTAAERVRVDEDKLRALCGASVALGVASPRVLLLAVRAARAAAALEGRDAVTEADAAIAARLVLAPRATRLPAPEEEETTAEDAPAEGEPDPQPPADQGAEDGADADAENASGNPLADMLVEAARAAVPADLLAHAAGLRAERLAGAPRSAGRAGAMRRTPDRGRPTGSRPGRLALGARLHLFDTLRAAAPWQRLRAAHDDGGARLRIMPDDVRLTRFKQRSGTLTIFAVDASGSAAMHRLGEAKGAVELLLADCYVRRDRVALVAFRGTSAEVLLPPTGALVMAKRRLAALPGGGATPLAAGLWRALLLAEEARRAGQMPFLVVLSDGRANIARDGQPGRARADADAMAMARQARARGVPAVVVDTATRPGAAARALADAMGARYMPLPPAGARALSRAIRDAAPSARDG